VNATERDTLILRYLDRASARGKTGRQQVFDALDRGGRGSLYRPLTSSADDAGLEAETAALRDAKSILDGNLSVRATVTANLDAPGPLDVALGSTYTPTQQTYMVRVCRAGY
jgi:hypothetical protein